MKQGIYKITCESNGKFYIGRTTDYHSRMSRHQRDLRNEAHKNCVMQNCFNKYGMGAFTFELIEEICDINEQIKREQELLDMYVGKELCMNINRSAETACDVPWTEERKRRISQSHIGMKLKPQTEEQRQAKRERMLGNVLSDETKRKISEKAKGRILSDETKRKISDGVRGEKHPMYGRRGSKHPLSNPILQIDVQTLEIVNRYPSAVDAAEQLNKNTGTIRNACKHNQIRYGYLWFKEAEFDIEKAKKITQYHTNKEYVRKGIEQPGAKAVIRIDSDGNEKEYPYLSAVEHDGYDPSNVSRVCRGVANRAYGFQWRFKKPESTIENTPDGGSE